MHMFKRGFYSDTTRSKTVVLTEHVSAAKLPLDTA